MCASIALAQPAAAPAGEPSKKNDEAREQHAAKKQEVMAKAKAAIAAHKEAREAAKAAPATPATPAAAAEGAGKPFAFARGKPSW